jgi:putative SOS response-associated peptidase YedK
MCGRFSQWSPPEVVAKEFGVYVPRLEPRYNVAPTQSAGVVRVSAEGGREFAALRWGLIPGWAKDPAIGNKLCNARAETVAEKPSFRDSLKGRRCVVPADGYYEWKREGARKQPYYFRRRDGRPLAIAGLWDRWEGAGGEAAETFAVITTGANDLAGAVHDRMPVVLSPDDYELWLGADAADRGRLGELLRPCPGGVLEAYPVSARVNSPKNDDPELTEPLG